MAQEANAQSSNGSGAPKSIEVTALESRLAELKQGLSSAHDEKRGLEDYLSKLEETILRTDGAVRVLTELISSSNKPAEPPPGKTNGIGDAEAKQSVPVTSNGADKESEPV